MKSKKSIGISVFTNNLFWCHYFVGWIDYFVCAMPLFITMSGQTTIIGLLEDRLNIISNYQSEHISQHDTRLYLCDILVFCRMFFTQTYYTNNFQPLYEYS